jgi:predicted  nucleic acid-binding Zn-ribbon protein
MPTENDKTKASADVKVSETRTRDEAKELKIENAKLRSDLEMANERIVALEQKLKEIPSGMDYAFLNGRIYQIAGVVEARFATDEARKGHLPNGLETELIILKP